jgi:Fic family protein
MVSKVEFEFLNSPVWIKYTQERYAPLDDIKYRLEKLGIANNDWPALKQKIQTFRKIGSIPFFLNSIDKKFWFFPSDSLNIKIHKIESLGNRLYDKIENHSSFKRELLTNVAVEEAITSAIYEGANSTRSKAKALIASGDKPKNKDEWILINNYLAMKWIKENSKLPISNGMILKIHEIVSNNTLEGDDANFCGKFRNDTVFVGHHQGVSFEKIEEILEEVIDLTTNHSRFLHSLIKGILFHYFISYIHPFFDGNGRTARTMFYLKAIKNDLKFVELLSVSANLKEHGKRYERSFELVKEYELDMTFFIEFCLDSLVTALEKIEKKINYLLDISKLIKLESFSSNQVSLLQRMALNKYQAISIEEYAEIINKSREISRRELKDLLEKGYLTEEKKGKKNIYKVKSKYLKERILRDF